MPKTISKTFRLPVEVAKEIENEAQKNNVSQTQYVTAVFVENKFLKLRKVFEENAKALEHDEAYKKEQQESAEADLL